MYLFLFIDLYQACYLRALYKRQAAHSEENRLVLRRCYRTICVRFSFVTIMFHDRPLLFVFVKKISHQ